MSSEIAEPLQEFISDLTSGTHISGGQAIDMIESQYGLDVSEVSHDDAQRFVDAFKGGDEDTVREVMDEYDVDEKYVDRFVDEMEFVQEQQEKSDDPTSSDEPDNAELSSNGSKPTATETGGLNDKQAQQVEEIVSRNSPNADEIVSKLESRLQSGGGGDGGQSQQAQQGAQTDQTTMAAKAIMEYLNRDQADPAAAQLGQKFQEKAMESAMQKMFAPDPFDIMRKKWAYKQAKKMEADDDLQEMMTGDFDLEEPDDDESGGFWGRF
jgi:hypothetical protein